MLKRVDTTESITVCVSLVDGLMLIAPKLLSSVNFWSERSRRHQLLLDIVVLYIVVLCTVWSGYSTVHTQLVHK